MGEWDETTRGVIDAVVILNYVCFMIYSTPFPSKVIFSNV